MRRYSHPMATKLVTANLPGFLEGAIDRRWAERKYRSRSEYVIGLLLWDIYCRKTHNFTGSLMKQPSWMLEKFVRGLVHDLGEPDPPPGDVSSYRFNVYVPIALMPLVKIRADEEGYRSGSKYVVSLVIYDLKNREFPARVPHPWIRKVMNQGDEARITFYGQIVATFGNPKRKWLEQFNEIRILESGKPTL